MWALQRCSNSLLPVLFKKSVNESSEEGTLCSLSWSNSTCRIMYSECLRSTRTSKLLIIRKYDVIYFILMKLLQICILTWHQRCYWTSSCQNQMHYAEQTNKQQQTTTTNTSNHMHASIFIWILVFRRFRVNDEMWQSVTAISVTVKKPFCFLSPIQNVTNKSSLAFAY